MRLPSIAAACIVMLELALRFGVGLGDPPLVVLDEKVEYRLVPSANYRRFGNRIEINSHGMRAPEHDTTANEKERRVLLIGDSVIYGNHFLDQDETIALRLKDRLENEYRLSDCTLVTMPAAASSWGPVNQAAFIGKLGTLDADVALIVVSAHDLFDVPNQKASLIPYRTRRSYGAIDDAAQMVSERVDSFLFPGAEDELPVEERRIQSFAAMDEMIAQLDADRVQSILVYHPTVIERRYGLNPAYESFARWAQLRSVEFTSLDSVSFDLLDDYRDNIHPAASGAEKIAEFFAQVVLPRISEC